MNVKIQLDVAKFIDDFSYLWNPLFVPVLKNENVVNFIAEAGYTAKKTPGESVLMLMSAVRYITGTSNYSEFTDNPDDFLAFINTNSELLKQIFNSNTIQANFPERAFPVLEVIGKEFKTGQTCVIELGASAGLIGKCLLNYSNLSGDKSLFTKNQQFPDSPGDVCRYTGIEINPPSEEWLLACFSEEADRLRISNFILKSAEHTDFKIIKGSAFDFPELLENEKFNGSKLVILTSFILYQFNEESRKTLITLIQNFCRKFSCIWINQMVDTGGKNAGYQYSIELNGKKVIRLADDRCTGWEWV